MRLIRFARGSVALVSGVALVTGLSWAQDAAPAGDTTDAPLADRVNSRLAELEAEAETLAGDSRTLLGELRQLEITRDLNAQRAAQASEAAAAAEAALATSVARLEELESRRVLESPDVAARLVELYKQGRGGNVRFVLGAGNLREMGRTARTLAAMSAIMERQFTEHVATLAAIEAERAAFEEQATAQRTAETAAQRARQAAAQAVSEHAALIESIDARRDLNAQLAGELQTAASQLEARAAALAAGGSASAVAVALGPFEGLLEWPATGAVIEFFGTPSPRLGNAARSGIEIAVPAGSPVRAIHPGTVEYAGAFSGYGTLVIVNHGDGAATLYGYLREASAMVGDPVDAGTVIGATGAAPAGPEALYFELRFDGRSVDPLQWLGPR